MTDAVLNIRGRDQTQAAFRSVRASLSRLAGTVRSLGLGAGVVGGAGFGVLVKNALEAGDKIHKLNLRLGASTEALSEYRHVANLSGISFEQLTMGWQRMTRRVAEAAQGTGEARAALQELGVSATRLAALRPEQQFEILTDALMGVEQQSDRVRLAMRLFDSAGVSLLQTMSAGSAGLREMRDEARRLGLSMSQETTNAAAETKDAIARLDASMQGLAFTLVRELGPSLASIGNTLTQMISEPAKAFEEGLRKHAARAIETQIKAQENLISGYTWLEEHAPVLTEYWARQREEAQATLDMLAQSIEKVDVLTGKLNFEGPELGLQRPPPVFGEEGEETTVERAQREAEERIEVQEALNRMLDKIRRRDIAAEAKAAENYKRIRANVTTHAIGLLQALGANSKAAAIAAIALDKARAVAQIIINTQVAVMHAMAQVPWPANLAVAAKIKTLGAISAGIVAATGLAQIANVGGGGASIGQAGGPPVQVEPVEPLARGQGEAVAEPRAAVHIHFVGDVYGLADFEERVTDIIKTAVDERDTVIISANSRNGQELLGRS